jgi:hypothetical protein
VLGFVGDRPEIWGIMTIGIGPVGYVADWDSPMEWMLRLVGTGLEGQSRSFDVMEISRPDDLGDIADLGMTLSEAKQLLGQVQRQIVAAQAATRRCFGVVQSRVTHGASAI